MITTADRDAIRTITIDRCRLSRDPGELASFESVSRRYGRMQVVGSAAEALHRISKQTIAAVDGIAAGAGLSLAMGCDVVVATNRAQFPALLVRRGLVVDFGVTWLLPRLVGPQKAKELPLSGRFLPATEALEMGMVTRLVDVGQSTWPGARGISANAERRAATISAAI